MKSGSYSRPIPKDFAILLGTTLTDEQWAEVIRYNGIDLGHTWFLLNSSTQTGKCLGT